MLKLLRNDWLFIQNAPYVLRPTITTYTIQRIKKIRAVLKRPQFEPPSSPPTTMRLSMRIINPTTEHPR
jgi:hypothetical protein